MNLHIVRIQETLYNTVLGDLRNLGNSKLLLHPLEIEIHG